MNFVFPLLIAVLSFPAVPAVVAAQDAFASTERPDDITVILDVSGSMAEDAKFASVQGYLEREVLRPLADAGDRFTMLTFGESAAEAFTERLAVDADRDRIAGRIRSLSADDDFTDIGVALEKLADVLEKRTPGEARPVILFITDGRHAPPPASPYSDTVLALDERFRDTGRRIAMQGWVLYVIGLGDGTDAAVVADAVEGSTLVTGEKDLSGAKLDDYLAGTAEVAAEAASASAPAPPAPAAAPSASAGVAGFLSLPLVPPLGILLLLLALAVLLLAFRPIEIRISDTNMGKRPVLVRKLRFGSSLRFNSADNMLPSIGNPEKSVFSLRRSLLGVRVLVEDEGAFAKESPFGSKGLHPLKDGVLPLANGGRITITK